MTREELEERMDEVAFNTNGRDFFPKTKVELKQLIRDCIEAVTPEKRPGLNEELFCPSCGGYDECDCGGFNEALDLVEANTKELLG